MVPLPRPGKLRISLSWGQAKLDLIFGSYPWGTSTTTLTGDSKGLHNGVLLDTDCTTWYWPESITFAAGTLVGTYRVAVNVYTYDSNQKCTGMNRRQFVGGETVKYNNGPCATWELVVAGRGGADAGGGRVHVLQPGREDQDHLQRPHDR